MARGRGTLVAGGLVAAFGLATAVSAGYIVEKREAALEVRFGDVKQVIREPGLYFKVPYLDTAYKYPLYRLTAQVNSNEANLRTSDQMRVEGGILVDFEVDETSADIENLYADLRIEGEEDIARIVRMRAKEAAVRAFGEFSSVELTSKINEITTRAKEILQADINEQNWPFRIKDVTSDGVKLSPDSERKLERVMAAEQEKLVLELREKNAVKAQTVLREEGKALAELYKELAKGGVRAEDIPTVMCLKMANDDDSIQVAFAPGCFPGQNGSSASPVIDLRNQQSARQMVPGQKP
jgi:membrane protease subunit HflC